MVPLGLPMVPLAPTFPPMVTLVPMVPLAAEKRLEFSGYQWYHWLPLANGTIGKIPNARHVFLFDQDCHKFALVGSYSSSRWLLIYKNKAENSGL